ncbi:MAG: hypothetical protein RLZZ210_997 [Pseudomonadota bacterium]|jgi:plasmid stabilization system protein ParE
MYQIFYEEEAETDLIEIIIFYSESRGIEYGRQINNIILSSVKSLEKMPFRSRQSDLIPNVREFLIRKLPYKVFIKVDDETKKVFILNIIHTSRKFP